MHALVEKMQFGAIDNRADGVVEIDAQLIGGTGIIESPNNQGRVLEATRIESDIGFALHLIVPPPAPTPGILFDLLWIELDPLIGQRCHFLGRFSELGKLGDLKLDLNKHIGQEILLV